MGLSLLKSRVKFAVHWACVGVLLVAPLAGCQTGDEQQAGQAVEYYYRGDLEGARQILDPIAKKPDSNFVLNNARLGSVEMAECRYVDAETAFLRAYEVINSVGVNNGGRSLGATLIDEKIKIWKGEPFERAMVNFYLGMLYYTRHDYGNARAAFENAIFKLRDYGKGDVNNDKYNEVDSNFALGYLMLAKCWQRLGDEQKAQETMARLTALRPDLASLADLPFNEGANLLLIVDWGGGPRKGTNADGAVVGFYPKPSEAPPIELPLVVVDGQPAPTNPMVQPPVDLLALAQDRKWQTIDTIRVIKSTAGTGLILAGAYTGATAQNSDQAGLAAGLILLGALLKATSQGDVRQWEMLPRVSFVIPLHVSPGVHDVMVRFRDGSSQTWHGLVAPADGDDTYYLRIWPGRPGPYQWPVGPMGIGVSEGQARLGG
jgi:tetratricopeptide (TPR) repeat protein